MNNRLKSKRKFMSSTPPSRSEIFFDAITQENQFSRLLLLLQLICRNWTWILSDVYCCTASLGTICRPVGALVEGYMIDKYGRKITMQVVSILISLAWIMTYFSRDVVMLYISRILLSFALGKHQLSWMRHYLLFYWYSDAYP